MFHWHRWVRRRDCVPRNPGMQPCHLLYWHEYACSEWPAAVGRVRGAAIACWELLEFVSITAASAVRLGSDWNSLGEPQRSQEGGRSCSHLLLVAIWGKRPSCPPRSGSASYSSFLLLLFYKGYHNSCINQGQGHFSPGLNLVECIPDCGLGLEDLLQLHKACKIELFCQSFCWGVGIKFHLILLLNGPNFCNHENIGTSSLWCSVSCYLVIFTWFS